MDVERDVRIRKRRKKRMGCGDISGPGGLKKKPRKEGERRTPVGNFYNMVVIIRLMWRRKVCILL